MTALDAWSVSANEQPWFADGFSPFLTDPTTNPIDTHEVVAMIAPRGLFIMDNPFIGELSPAFSDVAALGGAEVALAFKPRAEWPKAFRFYRLYR